VPLGRLGPVGVQLPHLRLALPAILVSSTSPVVSDVSRSRTVNITAGTIFSHSFHIHGVQFKILARNGSASAVGSHEQGWKARSPEDPVREPDVGMSPPGQGRELLVKGQVLDRQVAARAHGREERRQEFCEEAEHRAGGIQTPGRIVNHSSADAGLATGRRRRGPWPR
jgi:FtsP/CotA-like multicopper oxidase with cupredoxin domain